MAKPTWLQRLLAMTFDEGKPIKSVRLADAVRLPDGTLVAVPRRVVTHYAPEEASSS